MKRPAAWLMALNNSIDEVVDYRALALLRIAAGPLVLLHLAPFRESADEGIAYSDVFYEPYVAWFPDISRGGYFLLLNATAVAALLVTLGLFTRFAAPTTAALVGYNLFLSQTHFHHNRAFLLILLVGLALTPCGGALSLDARFGRHANTRARRWPLMLLRFELAVVYAASGFSKLLDPDWWSGLVNQIRLERYAQVVLDRGVPDRVVDLLLTPGFHTVTAKVIVLTELFIGLGLLWRRTRMAAIWVAIPFHIAIEISAEVQVFSYAALAALIVWATPAQRDREVALRPETSPIRALEWGLTRLDWMARFRVVRAADDGPSVTLVDRADPGGTPVVRHGPEAARMILSRLPLTFWMTAPLLLPGLRQFWDRRVRAAFGGPGPGRSSAVADGGWKS